MVMLTNALKVMINNSFYESFDITFMRNEKNCKNINCLFFSFSIIFFLNRLLTIVLRAFISISHIYIYIYNLYSEIVL